MKSLFARILVAQVVAVLLALAVVMLVTRVSLGRGFIDFLERQEAEVLASLAPALAEVYAADGGWSYLRDRPDNWGRILRQTRNDRPGPPGARGRNGPGRDLADGRPFEPRAVGQQLHWLRSMDRLRLRDRLFLLDEQRRPLAGAEAGPGRETSLQPITVDGAEVGWLGFAPMRQALPPEARRFLHEQLLALLAALGIALLLSAALAFALARYLSRPLRQLDATVLELAGGHYGRRARVEGAQEVRRLASNVNDLAATLERNRSARQRWIADIAHELRTPVAVLKGEVEALADGIRQPDPQRLASLGQEIEQLSVLVDDLQTLALADAGALDLRREPLDLAALVQQAAASFRERLGGRGIELVTRTPPRLEVVGDAGKLRRLLQNLLENCARYTDAGGRVWLTLEGSTAEVRLVVEDSGPGVPADDLSQLFERFYRVEQGRSRLAGGSGLGLSICRNIAEAHGGSIRAEASEHGGLAVIAILPAPI